MPPGGMELITSDTWDGWDAWGDPKKPGNLERSQGKLDGILRCSSPRSRFLTFFWGIPQIVIFFGGMPQAPLVQIPTVEDNNVEIVSEIPAGFDE